MEGIMSEGRLIGRVASELDMNPKTIRYYESIGLIPEPARSRSGYRVFTAEEVERLEFILKAKALDLSLEDIGEILDVRGRGEAPCSFVAEVLEQKLDEVEARIEALVGLRRELIELAERSESRLHARPADTACICQVIETD